MAGGNALEEPEVDAGFEFAFDNDAFSDKLLRIEVFGSSADAASREEADGAYGTHPHVSPVFVRQIGQIGDNEKSSDSSRIMMGTPILRVNTVNVNSAILAAKSPFFFKLFSNGMKESDQRQTTLRINDSEENAFMEVIRFMYSGKLTPTTEPTLLVDILMAADKFEVVSCMKLCAALAEAAKKFLAERYKEFLSTKFQDELMRIPLAGIVAILSRNHLVVASEEAVYDFVLRWADCQYPNSEERPKILGSRLLPLVPIMRAMKNVITINQPSYKLYINLERERCSRLFLSGSEYCRQFRFMGHLFVLSAHCNMDSSNSFGLLLEMPVEDKELVRRTIDYKFEANTRPTLEFDTKYESTCTIGSREDVRCKDLFSVPWTNFIADDSPFFIDDILHLRIHLKIVY
ncbi:hypothetical protein QYE76_020307 [Lolium multiflorum]|uniref:BTB domain-containing protein n=1 Tax=Lolium multiflorum TaxID=4521 RepID=A0AAD8R4K7_LOLMU|nr:hypothetical protein QYE76_020307 [Lolium multiflorum]